MHLAMVGKLYKTPPSEYLGIIDPYMAWAVDFGCACAYWENENHNLKVSTEKAKEQAGAIGEKVNQT